MAKKVYYNAPGLGVIKREQTYGTRYIQDDEGHMQGRKKVKGKGDGTGVIRAKKEFTLVKPGKRKGHIRHYEPGEILGRY